MPQYLAKTLLLAAALLLSGRGLAAQDPAAELDALVAAHEKSEAGYAESYAEFRPRFEAFAARHAGTEHGLGADLWLLQQTWWQREDGTMESAATTLLDEILAGHPRSPQLHRVVEYRYVLPADRRVGYFEELLGITPHAEVKAAARFGIARELRGSNDAKKQARARAELELLRREFGDVAYKHTTYGAMARSYLSPHPAESLAVGKKAPEIVGATRDGKAMKLSQFRGKVVVLDFWGDW